MDIPFQEECSVKRLLSLLLIALFVFGLAGCGSKSAKPIASAEPEETSELSALDAFYAHPALGDYADLRTLDADYSTEQAQADGCFVIGAMNVYNDDLYAEFMEHFRNHEDAFIRVAQSTVEGDLILTDVLYDSTSGNVYLVHDSTRDAFSAESDRVIALHTYSGTAEYDLDGHLYWIAYNGEISDLNLSEEYSRNQAFVIAYIN